MISRVLPPMLGGSSVSSSARGSRLSSTEERTRRSYSNATSAGRMSWIDRQVEQIEHVEEGAEEKEVEEGEEHVQEEEDDGQQQHQQVLRRHEPRRSVPSVIDLFGTATFTPPKAADVRPAFSASDPSSGPPSDPISAGDLASSSDAAAIWRRPQHDLRTSPRLPPAGARYPPQFSPPTAYRDGSSVEASASSSSAGRTTSGLQQPLYAETHCSDNSPFFSNSGRSRDGAGLSSASRPVRPDDVEDQQQPGRQDQQQQQQQSLPETIATGPTLTTHSEESAHQRVACDGREAAAAHGVLSSDFFTAPPEQKLEPARHMREASTVTVDAGREGERAIAGEGGAAAGRWAGHQLHQEEVRTEEIMWYMYLHVPKWGQTEETTPFFFSSSCWLPSTTFPAG